jgi:glycosyltransferase involved in cell wall biosynthesis
LESNTKILKILGTRGIPAKHGGFETFAEKIAIELTRRGWKVIVYCQLSSCSEGQLKNWYGVDLVHIPVRDDGAFSSIVFDFKATCAALSGDGLLLTLGYNTAVFNILNRLKGQTNIINMDGIEWRREKWGFFAKLWFWVNERIASWFGNHLVADNPGIRDHLVAHVSPKKITMIPYGADEVQPLDDKHLIPLGLSSGDFSVIIARPEPENSFIEMIRAFSAKTRNHKLVVLGNFKPQENAYHEAVIASASDEVSFVGALYDTSIVQALRYHAKFYLHGHQVGGTNPSLVEAMGAGCAIIAHDNKFNRWVAREGAAYFASEAQLLELLDTLLTDCKRQKDMQAASLKRFKNRFNWERIFDEYEKLLLEKYPKRSCE